MRHSRQHFGLNPQRLGFCPHVGCVPPARAIDIHITECKANPFVAVCPFSSLAIASPQPERKPHHLTAQAICECALSIVTRPDRDRTDDHPPSCAPAKSSSHPSNLGGSFWMGTSEYRPAVADTLPPAPRSPPAAPGRLAGRAVVAAQPRIAH